MSQAERPLWKADAGEKRRRCLLLEKSDLAWIDLLLAAWILDLAVLAAFLHKANSIAALCILAAILVAAAAGLTLEVRHRRQNRACIVWAVIGPMILVHLALLSGAAISRFLPLSHDYSVDKFALYQVGDFSDGTARFASLSKPLTDGRVFISPIDVLILLQVRNMTAEVKQIRDYKIDGFIADRWRPLCRVPLAPNPPYYLSTRSTARELILTPFAPERGPGAMAPGQARTFWSAWTCPQKCDLAKTRLRVTVTDQKARREAIEFSSGGAMPAKAFDAATGIGIGDDLDLDAQRGAEYVRGYCANARDARRRAGLLW